LFLVVSSLYAADKGEDFTGKLISSEWRLFNRTVDTFFSNKYYREGENKSSILISTAFIKSEGKGGEGDFDLQMRFDLPQMTKKLKIVIEREQNEIKKALTDENVTRNKRQTRVSSSYKSIAENSYTAGADYLLLKLKNFTSLMKFGFRLDLPINPYLKLNLSREIKTKYVDINLMQTFLLYRQAGLQEITSMGFIRKFNEDYQLEQLNSLVWTDEKDVYELRHSLTLYQNLSEKKALSYALGANAKLSPTFSYNSYDASVSYRMLLHSNWLYGTSTVGAEFPKALNFKDDKFVQLRLDAFFQ
jgi:hypothetical protein